ARDRRRRSPAGRAAARQGRADRGEFHAAREGQPNRHVARQLVPADGGVLGKVPATSDGRPVEPFIARVLEHVAEEALYRVGREDGRLGKAQLEVMDHRGGVPHELAVGCLHDGHAARVARRHGRRARAGEAPEQPRDALVVEVAGHLAREVRLHHAVDAVDVRSHRRAPYHLRPLQHPSTAVLATTSLDGQPPAGEADPGGHMGTERMEAFSDGVIAIIITIMVLELKVPQGADLAALRELAPVLASYVLSFVYVAIYWNNH